MQIPSQGVQLSISVPGSPSQLLAVVHVTGFNLAVALVRAAVAAFVNLAPWVVHTHPHLLKVSSTSASERQTA